MVEDCAGEEATNKAVETNSSGILTDPKCNVVNHCHRCFLYNF